MDERTIRALELPRVLEQLSIRCLSDAGKEAVLALRPMTDPGKVTHAQFEFDEARSWAAEGEFRPSAFPDLSAVLDILRSRETLLDTDALWAFREVLNLAQRAAQSILEGAARRPLLAELASAPVPEAAISGLNRCLAEDGGLKDESSPGLLMVRTELRGLHQGCLRRVKDYAEKYNIGHYLQDDYMTLASDRYVLPLKANFKGRLQGIIHDYSRTGETLYFEPMFLVEHNNRLQELKNQEREEERKVLRLLTELLIQDLPRVESAWNLLIAVDILFAKCALGAALDGRCVPLEAGNRVNLIDARHPLLVLEAFRAARKAETKDSKQEVKKVPTVIPVDLALRDGDMVLVISGGNAGGKTVALKTLGLIVLMTLCGLPVPVSLGSTLPPWRDVHAFIGDEQSLDDHVSTFTGQITHLADIWPVLGPDTLVLLDEFGAGTDPSQGAALAQAVLDGLLEKSAYAVTATHFPALKTYALTRDNVRAASVLFDQRTKKPMYRLAYDQVGASQALDVAREHGLPDMVLRRAEHYLLIDGQDSGAIMERLNALAVEREQELDTLRREEARTRDKRRQLQETFEKERAKLYEELRRKSQELMSAWKSGKATAKQAMRDMSRLRAELVQGSKPAESHSPAPTPTIEQFRVGDTVKHKPWNKKAVLTELDERGGRAKLDMGGVSLWASLSDLDLPNAAAPVVLTPARNMITTRVSQPSSFLSLDVRGKRADIALAELEQFLDRALLAGPDGVEIIHGRGTGALRKAVHQVLKTFPGVASYTLAPEDQGGDGATIVTFR